MTEDNDLRMYASFTVGILAACLGVSAEWTGQVLYLAGRWLMDRADRLEAYALQVCEIEPTPEEREINKYL